MMVMKGPERGVRTGPGEERRGHDGAVQLGGGTDSEYTRLYTRLDDVSLDAQFRYPGILKTVTFQNFLRIIFLCQFGCVIVQRGIAAGRGRGTGQQRDGGKAA